MPSSELNKPLMTYSDVESKRFGMRVFRGTIDEINEKQILSSIIENKVDLAILRIPASKQYQISRLEKTGLPYIVADTLVYYSVDLTTYVPKPIRNKELVFESGSLEHIDSLNALVEIIFASYTNHYTSNPYLKRKDITDGYKEWACACIGRDSINPNAWVIKKSEGNIGFITFGFDQKTVEVLLNGVIPSASGNGVYTDIIRYSQYYFKYAGFSRMIIPTQIQNLAVQKIWAREGFELSNAYITIHINSFMNVSTEEVETIQDSIISPGDTNLMLYNDDFTHELNELISKYISTIFPGHGTVFLGYSYRFLKPLCIDEQYKVLISFPFINAEGIYRALVKVIDQKNEVCWFSYYDLYKK